MAVIYNDEYNTLLSGTSGHDSIFNDGGSKVTIKTGTGNDTILSYNGDRISINAGEDDDYILNEDEGNNITIIGGKGHDTVRNYSSEKVSIDTGAGNDSIYSTEDSFITIDAGSGNDKIYTNYSSNVTINTGEGNNFVSVRGNGNYDEDDDEYGVNIKIIGGTGKDTVYNYASNVTIDTGAGNDSIYAGGTDITVIGGTGNDSIVSKGKNILFKYTEGDGNDRIEGMSMTDTLQIGGGKGTYSSQASGEDIIVTVGEGKITLVGAVGKSVYIEGKKSSASKNTWKLNGTTATYGTSGKTLVTVKGVKSTSGLSVSGKVVTVKKSSLGTDKVTISDGYTLKLGSDVTKSSTKKAAFSLSGSTATYKQTTTAGYTLSDNEITYSKASSKTLATIKGAASTSGLSISGNKITLKKSALKSKVTVSGGYEFDFASDYGKATITGSSKSDTITSRGKNISVNADSGDDTIKMFGTATVSGGDGSDLFIYSAGNNVIADYSAEDTISIAGGTAKVTTSGSDLIFTADNGKITVKGGANKTVTYFDSDGKHAYKKSSDNAKLVTLDEDYDKETYTMGDKLRTVDASAVELDIKITGNKYINKIVGGAGNDTLIGGKSNDTLVGNEGSDIFVYNKGDGNDKILDYAEEDKISISGDKVSNIKSKGSDIIFTVGSGTITVIGGKDKRITYVDSKGEHIYPQIFTVKGKTITLTEDYSGKSFNVTDYGNYNTINASAVEHGLNIVGNDFSNSITGTSDEDIIDGGSGNDTIRGGDGNDSLFGGKGKDYLYGGEGNDTLWGGVGNDYLYGGEGADIFIFDKNDGTNKIFDYEQGIDKIMILSNQKPALDGTPLSNDVTFNVGDGKIVVANGAHKSIKFVKSNGKSLYTYVPSSAS